MWIEASVSNVWVDGSDSSSVDGTATRRSAQQIESNTSDTMMGQRQPENTPIHSQNDVNPYHVLQVRQDATPSEILLSYKRLALWHHPGRSLDVSTEERQRRLQVFELVSACYETLIDRDCRKRYDILLRRARRDRITAGLPVGELHVGGKAIIEDHAENTTLSESPCTSLNCGPGQIFRVFDGDSEKDNSDVPPSLSRTSSQSTFLFGGSFDELEEEEFMDDHVPGVSIALSDHGGAEIQFTRAETSRIFGGHLAVLYRARKWEDFSDPFVMFDKVFGSRLFKISANEIGRLNGRIPVSPSRNVAWTGSSHRLGDGTTVFTTKRSLHDRTLTRTEYISTDSNTRSPRYLVSVSSEDNMQAGLVDVDGPTDAYNTAYLTCNFSSLLGEGSSNESGTDASICSSLILRDNLSLLGFCGLFSIRTT